MTKNLFNQRNPRLINHLFSPGNELRRVVLNLGNLDFDIVLDFDIRISDFASLGPSTFVVSPLQIHLFLCKTNPICWDAQMNVTSVTTTNYKENHPSSHPKNKPNSNPIQTQTNPIGSDAQNKRNFCYNNRLRRKPASQPPQKQTQFKPNSNPISPPSPLRLLQLFAGDVIRRKLCLVNGKC